MANIALIIAGGSGTRMKQDIPKQFLTVNEKPVIIYTLEAFQNHPEIDCIAVACLESWISVLWAYAKQFNITKLQYVVPGGAYGQGSIRNGLYELKNHFKAEDLVLVHDGNRPMVSAEIISDCIITAQKYGCAIAAIPCVEAIFVTQDGIESSESIPRNNLRRTQTPHAFSLGKLLELHDKAFEKGITNSVASGTLAIELGEKVYFSIGSEKNLKLTTLDDIDIFKALLLAKRASWLKE